jgi:hypothetical protein
MINNHGRAPEPQTEKATMTAADRASKTSEARIDACLDYAPYTGRVHHAWLRAQEPVPQLRAR